MASLSESLIAASVSQLYALHLLQQLGGSGGASAAQAHQLARALSLERLIVQAVQLLPLLPRLVSILKAFASSAQASSNQAFEGPASVCNRLPVSLLVPTPACCAPCKQAGRLGDTVFWSANPHVFINCGQHARKQKIDVGRLTAGSVQICVDCLCETVCVGRSAACTWVVMKAAVQPCWAGER